MRTDALIVSLCVAAQVANADTHLKSIDDLQPLTDAERAAGITRVALCDDHTRAPAERFQSCGTNCMKRLEVHCKTALTSEPADTTGISASTMSWQASALNGLSGFIAERSKAEVINWAEGLIAKHLCSMTSPPVPPAIAREARGAEVHCNGRSGRPDRLCADPSRGRALVRGERCC
jgi:hypothetical protein